MTTTSDAKADRIPLSRERVLAAAVALADEAGIEAVSMRKLGQQLGVEAMSLYNHVANKEDILDGMVEAVMEEVSLEREGADWKEMLRNLILRSRANMLKHLWVPSVMETRQEIGIGVMRYFNEVLGILRAGGFSYDLAHHALHALSSRALGFTQELFEPEDDQKAEDEVMRALTEMSHVIPNIVEMVTQISHTDGPDETLGWCDDQTEFLFALDLLLDGLELKRQAEMAG